MSLPRHGTWGPPRSAGACSDDGSAHSTRRHWLAALCMWPALARPASGPPEPPGQAIKLIVPAPPGGAMDLFARALAEQLALALAQPVLVENISGAGGLVAAKAGARARPDGYTLVLIQSGMLWVQALNPRLDILREFIPVARLVRSPLALVVRIDSQNATLAELIAAVRARPGRFSFGSGGIGSPAQIAVVEMADRLPGFEVIHIPYNGAAEAAVALARGDIDFEVGVLGAVLPMIQAGRLRALAVTGANRLALLPEVPTLSEAGLAGVAVEPWAGLVLPAGASPAVVARLQTPLLRALETSELKALMTRLAMVADYAESGLFMRQIERELRIESMRARRLGAAGKP